MGGSTFLAVPPHLLAKIRVSPPWGGANFGVVPPHLANPWGGNHLLPPIFRDPGGGIEKCSPPSPWGGECQLWSGCPNRLGGRSFKGHFRQHRSQIGKWCYIFSSRVSLKVIKVLYRANFMSVGPVFHELYETNFSEKKIFTRSRLVSTMLI